MEEPRRRIASRKMCCTARCRRRSSSSFSWVPIFSGWIFARHGLVEQDSLDARFARLNPRAKFGCCDFQRLEAQAAEDAFVRAIREQRHASESANIVVTKLAAIIESEEYVGVQLDGRLRRADADFAGHAEVNQQRTFFGGSFSRLQVQNQVFSQATDARECAARQILFQRRGIVN